MIVYIQSDNIVVIDGVKDTVTDLYINAYAQITGQVYENQTALGAVLTFEYVPESDGQYKAEIPNTVDIKVNYGEPYYLLFSVIYQGKKTTFQEKLEPAYKNTTN
jgi:hypothetical protein